MLSCPPKAEMKQNSANVWIPLWEIPLRHSICIGIWAKYQHPLLPRRPCGPPVSVLSPCPAPWWALGLPGRFPTGGASHDSFPTGGFYPPPSPPSILGMVDITRKVPRVGNMPYDLCARGVAVTTSGIIKIKNH